MNLPVTAIILTNENTKQFQKTVKSLQDFDELLIITNNLDLKKKEVDHSNVHIVEGQKKPITDFAAARNAALKKAAHNWVLFVDNDEVLEPFTTEDLSQLLTSTEHTAFSLIRQDFFMGKKLQHGEAGNQKLVRLMHKKYSSFIGAIHEVAITKGSTGIAPLKITHYAHENISEFIADITRYATLIGKLTVQPKRLTLFQMLVFPPAKFVQNFVLRQGFRDGFRGFVYAVIMSLHSLIVRISTYEHTTKK